MTPYLIAESLNYWMVAGAAYPVVFWSLRRVTITGPLVAKALVGPRGSRRFDAAEVAALVLLMVMAVMLAGAADSLKPDPQWWSQPLTTDWEISIAVVVWLSVLAELLLVAVAVALAAIVLLAVMVWINDGVVAQQGSDLQKSWRSWRQRHSRQRVMMRGGQR